jgi:O-antigen/teichoic acid export membrane protein
VIIAIIVYRSYSNGSKSVSKNFYIEGLLFLGSDLSLLVIITMDKFFLAKIMSLDELAVYFSIFAITRLYDLALQATEFVLMPYSNKMEKLALGRILAFVTVIAIAITLFYLLFGEILLNLIYGDKYAEGLHLIAWFCAIGITRMFYCVPASIIGGRLKQQALRYLLVTNTGLIVVNIALVALFISYFGLVGAVAGTLVVWILRNIGAYTLLLKYKA